MRPSDAAARRLTDQFARDIEGARRDGLCRAADLVDSFRVRPDEAAWSALRRASAAIRAEARKP